MTKKTLQNKRKTARKRRAKSDASAENATISLSFLKGETELVRFSSARKRDTDSVRRALLNECWAALAEFETEDLVGLLPVLAEHVGILEDRRFTDPGPPPVA